MRCLITGITGFVGSHLADYLLERDEVEVFGMDRWRSRAENIEHLGVRVKIIEGDIKDATSIRKIIEEVRPDRIFHLAAHSVVSSSWDTPAEIITTNIIGNLNILETVRQLGLSTRIQIACSAEEYGFVHPNEVPITEENPLRPLSPYAVSKVGQDLLSYQYFMNYGSDVIRTRAFNHTGPRGAETFVASNFAKQIVMVEKGWVKPVLYVGNLEARRDFTDVRDMVRAYWLALERGQSGEAYNICSGKAYTIKEVLDMLLGMAKVHIEVRHDPKRMRPSDVPILLGDNSKFCRQTGWKPEIPFETTLRDLLEYWREKIRIKDFG